MSQYPPQQYPPQLPPSYGQEHLAYGSPGPDPLAPARRAGVMLFIVGGLMLLCGTCLGVASWALPIDKLLAQSNVQLPPAPPGMTLPGFLHLIYTVMGVGGFLIGVLVIVLGIFVRRGARWASVTGIVLSLLLLALVGLNMLGSLVSGGGPAVLAGALVVSAVPGLFLIITLVFLFQAVRVDARALAMSQQYQMQMWQQYQQHPYGFVPPPPPAGPSWDPTQPPTQPPPPPPPGEASGPPAVRHPPLPPTPPSDLT